MRRGAAVVLAVCLLAVGLAAGPAGAAPPQGNGNNNQPSGIEADCYEPDIGTVQTAIGVNSSVGTVCFDPPTLVDRENLKFYAVDIRISGVDSSPWTEITPDYLGCGYGFGPFDPDCGHRQAAYEDVPVTLWFPRNWENGQNKTLVQYHFSSSFSSDEGEEQIGLGAIQQGMAYTAHDGKFFAGVSGTVIDGPFAGEEVPLVSSSMTRDVASVASDWLDRYMNQAPDHRYITGWSLGGWVITGLMADNYFGFEMANNHIDPDDLSSEPFYDAALYVGASGGYGTVSTTPGPGATVVPSIHVESEQESSSNRWPYVASWIDLVPEGEASDFIAWWSIRDQNHVPLEREPVEIRDLFTQDFRGPILAAAVESLHDAVTKGKAMKSYMGGEIVPREAGDPVGSPCFLLPGGPDPDRRVQWETLDGAVTYSDPIKLLSTDVFHPFDFSSEPCGLEIDALEELQAALDPKPAIVPPIAANRVGPHYMAWGIIVPGEQFDVCALYGNLNGYIGALNGTAGQLRGEGVWKPLPGTTGIRVSDVFDEPTPFTPPPGPYPGIVGTFQEQGCA